MENRLSVCAQHHPSREGLLPGLRAGIAPLELDVVSDPEPQERPSAWRTYRRCLEETPAWATHRVVLQDDSILCRNFGPALERLAAACPCSLLVLCVCGNAARIAPQVMWAVDRGDRWAELPPSGSPLWIPAVALVWPTEFVPRVLAYVDAQPWPAEFVADDEIIGRAAAALDLPVCVTAPSLVDHDDEAPSLVRHRPQRDPGRRAALFIGDGDPLALKWN